MLWRYEMAPGQRHELSFAGSTPAAASSLVETKDEKHETNSNRR